MSNTFPGSRPESLNETPAVPTISDQPSLPPEGAGRAQRSEPERSDGEWSGARPVGAGECRPSRGTLPAVSGVAIEAMLARFSRPRRCFGRPSRPQAATHQSKRAKARGKKTPSAPRQDSR
jgi:hypothetical protein